MEAPKKIYLFKNPITETPDDRWLSKRSCNEDIECVRKDALLEWAKIKQTQCLEDSTAHAYFKCLLINLTVCNYETDRQSHY